MIKQMTKAEMQELIDKLWDDEEEVWKKIYFWANRYDIALENRNPAKAQIADTERANAFAELHAIDSRRNELLKELREMN